MSGYLRPVDPTWISTYRAHTRRVPPSLEAGVDYGCPIGTPIRAGIYGRVVQLGGSTIPATGRFVVVDLDDGRRMRDLHLSQWAAGPGTRVEPDTILGYSGASGYGSEYFGASSLARLDVGKTGGPHVHRTLWPTRVQQYGRYPLEPTLDFEQYVERGIVAGEEEDAMNPIQEKKLDRLIELAEDISAALGAGGAKAGVPGDRLILNSAAEARDMAKQARDALHDIFPTIVGDAVTLADIKARVENIDRQVVGADGFDADGRQSVASRVIAIQNAVIPEEKGAENGTEE